VNLIGVDVDSTFLVCQIQRDGKSSSPAKFDNTSAGHRKFIKWATKRGATARVCLEATGVYSLPFALSLHAEQHIEVAVVNPRAIKKYADSIMQRGKTDLMDAAVILDYLQRMPFKQWQPPSEETLEIQHICRRVVQLNVELNREGNRHKAAKRLGTLGKVVAHDTELTMRHLQRRIDALEQTVLNLIQRTPKLQQLLELLVTTTGIALKTGPRILAELLTLPTDMSAKQWVAHAGLDPKPHESGSSTNKPRRISRQGNQYLRNALYFPALVASRRDANVKAYYEKMINAGKKPLQAIVAIMRKMLLSIWGMFKYGQAWDGNKFYVIENTA